MRKVKIDLRELIDAFENCSLQHQYFLDTKNGEIIFISEYDDQNEDDQNEQEQLYDKIDSDPQRYLKIPEYDSAQGYNDMVDFTNTVTDRNLQEKLEIALDGKGAFRRFKDVLFNYPSERERWFKFKEERIRERIKNWLEENEIQVTVD